MAQNTTVIFKKYTNDGPITADNFEISTSAPVPTDCADGEAIVRLVVLSVDPYMRSRMRNVGNPPGYLFGPFPLDKPVETLSIARVVKSKKAGLVEGALLSGMMDMVEVQVLSAAKLGGLQVVDNSDNLSPSLFLNVLGLSGITAYLPLLKYGHIKEGEVAYVSGAAGSVGVLVGQLLKTVFQCKVIGSAGSNDKARFLVEKLGFDAAFNYKSCKPAEGLKQHAPEGIDLYYDNVGGETLEAAIGAMRSRGRILMCGTISQYDLAPEKRYGVTNMFDIVTKSITIQGFLPGDYPELMTTGLQDLRTFVKEGKLKAIEHTVKGGLAAAPGAFVDMMAGANIGKMAVWVEDPPAQ